MKLVEGVTIGSRYRLLSPLGAGAQGAVWRAADLARDGAEVALKLVDVPLDAAQTAALLDLVDPTLARVLDVGAVPGGGGFVVMERVEGVALDAVDAATCAAVAGDVATALAVLHARGMVHGDVKPANVLVHAGRAVLVDLGLVGAARAAGDAVDGTLAYLAPESLLGERSAQTDLHALGVTLALCLGGGHPFVRDPSSRDALREAVAPDRAVRDDVLARVPAALRDGLRWLLAWAPEDRPPSASAWRARWLRDVGIDAGDAVALTSGAAARARPPRVGGEDSVKSVARAALDALAGDGFGAVVVGPSGAGRRRVVEDALRRVRVDAARRGIVVEVATEVPVSPARPTVVLCVDASAEGLRRARAALHRRRRFAPDAPTVALLGTCAEEVSAEGLREVALGPLDRVRAQRLLDALHGARVPSTALDAWIDVTAGLAGRVVSLARRLGDAAIGNATRASLFGELARDAPDPVPAALDDEARAALAALALVRAPVPAPLARSLGTAPTLAALARAGVIVPQGDRVFVGAVDLGALDAASRSEGARRLARVEAAGDAFVTAAQARALALLGDPRGAYAAMVRAAARPEVSRDTALAWLCEAAPWSADHASHGRSVAGAMVLAGDPVGAAALLSEDVSAEARGLRLDALRRAGARDALRDMAMALTRGDDAALRATGALALARDALDRGALDDARGWYAAACEDPRVARRALEVGALLAAAEGALDLADDRVERAEADAIVDGDAPRRHRLRAVAGIIAMRRGDPALARRLHREAWQLALVAGDLDAAASYLVNVGGAALDAGDLGDALRSLERAVEPLAALGRLGTLGRALGNLASLLAWIGDGEAARRYAQRAVDAATESDDAIGAAFARGVLAELGGDAAALYAAADACAAHGDTVRGGELRARAVARCVAAGELDRARAMGGAGDGAMAALAALALALAGSVTPDALRAKRAEADRAVAAEPSVEHALWHLALSEEVARRCGDRAAAEGLHAARRERVRGLAATLPDALAQTFRRAWDPGEATTRASEDPSRWRRLAAITQRLNGEARLPVLLELVMDAVIELTGAERGFVLLREDGGLAVRTARNVGARALAGDEMSFSRSVAERVAASGEALVTVDAAHDARFDAAESVVALRMRSILAVPLRVQGEVVGTLYVDDRLRAGAFDDDAVEVAKAFADGAALAIHNARARRELERALRRAERLSEELDLTVARQRAELEVARESRDPDGVRGRYDELVGRGPAMTRTLALLDRVAPTSMPVLLLGESGTGKELVARALHANSPRRGAAFVAENCGAIPETLLESVLFGHVKGAFTGADRARAGLFEAADGGTLFLDEIGEMSLPMQSRLLRVLQEGEVRPVGGERVRRVDVRVIAATHRDLADMVRRGAFREDLYYRLAVLVVPVPALRERREDIPALVAHFLARHGGGVGIERKALARLVAAPWPGNVRELENEVRRAAVLASEGTIREEDLSASAPAAHARAERGGAALRGTDIRDAVHDVERALVERALREHAGNQSRAAKALGLSRFGLQKKLKRLGISARAIAAESSEDQ